MKNLHAVIFRKSTVSPEHVTGLCVLLLLQMVLPAALSQPQHRNKEKFWRVWSQEMVIALCYLYFRVYYILLYFIAYVVKCIYYS